MALKYFFFYSGLVLQADAQPYHLSPSGVQQVNEGNDFRFNCTVETGSIPIFIVLLNGAATDRRTSETISSGILFTFGPVNITDDGSILHCSDGNVVTEENATLYVTRKFCFIM